MKNFLPLLVVVSGLITPVFDVRAQDRPIALEEVVVTAQLRTAPLLNQVGSISVITAQDIREREAQHPSIATNLLSGLQRHRG